jgi:hypothetical protein
MKASKFSDDVVERVFNGCHVASSAAVPGTRLKFALVVGASALA